MQTSDNLAIDLIADSNADFAFDRSSGCPCATSQFDGQPLREWLHGRRDRLDACLDLHGAVLLRGFSSEGGGALAGLVRAYGSDPLPVEEESSPRTALGGQVFTSTEYPPEETIAPHNECSYRIACPSRLFFYCERPGASGGQTTLVDCDAVGARIDPETLEQFRRHGWAYYRRYGVGLGVGAERAFGLRGREEIERYCARHDIQTLWRGEALETRQHRSAFIAHPSDGRAVWFNHVCFFHHSAVPADLLEVLGGAEHGPYDTRFGDGQPIETELIEHLREAYRASLRAVSWRKGDLLIVDNLRMAHGRLPFSGQRRILFAMSDLVQRPPFHSSQQASP